MGDKVKTEDEAKAAAPPAAEEQTSSHIPVRPLYTPADMEGWDYDRQVGYPGRPGTTGK